ncbi:hypothetical protein PR048_030007 [Dryococelus australis]|uniref:Uncharacterized protein n=1 Tax=Dryococelus australis TaxID=614101 RepID=A0ABQ9G7R1_9NEOP|nr:hypothetical protein PR048_030007 [Dryococelus australis]
MRDGGRFLKIGNSLPEAQNVQKRRERAESAYQYFLGLWEPRFSSVLRILGRDMWVAKYLLTLLIETSFAWRSEEFSAAFNFVVSRAAEVEVMRVWSSSGMNRQGKREIPEKTRRPAASSGKIPKHRN